MLFLLGVMLSSVSFVCSARFPGNDRPGLVEAAAKELDGFRGFRGLKPGKRQARMP